MSAPEIMRRAAAWLEANPDRWGRRAMGELEDGRSIGSATFARLRRPPARMCALGVMWAVAGGREEWGGLGRMRQAISRACGLRALNDIMWFNDIQAKSAEDVATYLRRKADECSE